MHNKQQLQKQKSIGRLFETPEQKEQERKILELEKQKEEAQRWAFSVDCEPIWKEL